MRLCDFVLQEKLLQALVATIDVKGFEPLKPRLNGFDNDVRNFQNEQMKAMKEILHEEGEVSAGCRSFEKENPHF